MSDVLTDFSCFLSVSDMNARDETIILEQATNFVGAFAKLRKAIISCLMSVRPSVWNISFPTGQIFVKLGI